MHSKKNWVSWSWINLRFQTTGMYDFMQDHGGISAVFKVPLEVRQKLYEGVAPPRKKMDVQPGFFIVVFEAESRNMKRTKTWDILR